MSTDDILSDTELEKKIDHLKINDGGRMDVKGQWNYITSRRGLPSDWSIPKLYEPYSMEQVFLDPLKTMEICPQITDWFKKWRTLVDIRKNEVVEHFIYSFYIIIQENGQQSQESRDSVGSDSWAGSETLDGDTSASLFLHGSSGN